MKFLTYLFSLYILALSIMPCSDLQNECSELNTKSSHNQKHDHQTDHEDSCSPFCTCSCCGMVIAFNFENTSFRIKALRLFPQNRKEVIIKNSIFYSNFYGSIWQPPKVLSIS